MLTYKFSVFNIKKATGVVWLPLHEVEATGWGSRPRLPTSSYHKTETSKKINNSNVLKRIAEGEPMMKLWWLYRGRTEDCEEKTERGKRSVIEMLPYLKTIGFCAWTFVHILREGDFKDQWHNTTIEQIKQMLQAALNELNVISEVHMYIWTHTDTNIRDIDIHWQMDNVPERRLCA